MEITRNEPPDKIPLSALNQYAYCPRRCYLIHAEGEFTHNIHTESGSREHERVDQLAHDIKKGVRVEFALPVWSDALGISGRCDVVEFHPDGTVFPIEYSISRPNRREQIETSNACAVATTEITVSP